MSSLSCSRSSNCNIPPNFAQFINSGGRSLCEGLLVFNRDFHNHTTGCLCVRLAVRSDDSERGTSNGPDHTAGLYGCYFAPVNKNLDEAKMVLVSYHAQRNLTMSANFIVSAPTRTKKNANGQAETLDAELKDVANGEGIVEVKPIASEVTG